ncbi:peregrin-like [Artemia franciscana]|uniref:peregrin-like n=1 Tax=Artemia franciscana TaxID=6661 RepID=UPI0032DBBDE4
MNCNVGTTKPRPKPVQRRPGRPPIIKRPLERLSHSSTDSEVEAIKRTRHIKSPPGSENGVNKGRSSAKVGRKPKVDSLNAPVSKLDFSTPVKTASEPGSLNNSPAGVNRRTSVLFNKKAAISIPKPDFRKNASSQKPQLKKKVETPFKVKSASDSDDTSRSLFDPDRLRGDGEVDSLAKERESFKIYRTSSSESELGSENSEDTDSESDSEDTSDSDIERSASLIPLEPLDLVWAKCRGYPWYPALIINPKMPQTGYYHNGVPIPVPPQEILDLASKLTEPKFLVLFFDSKRTWQWLPRSKLELLGVDPNNDKSKLVDSKKPVHRKAVKKAYEEAILHRSRVTGETHSLSGESEDAE